MNRFERLVLIHWSGLTIKYFFVHLYCLIVQIMKKWFASSKEQFALSKIHVYPLLVTNYNCELKCTIISCEYDGMFVALYFPNSDILNIVNWSSFLVFRLQEFLKILFCTLTSCILGVFVLSAKSLLLVFEIIFCERYVVNNQHG